MNFRIPVEVKGSLRLSVDPIIVRLKRPQKRPGAFINSITSQGVTITGRIKKLELKEGQFVTATVSLKTKAGHDAAYQAGSESWESSDESVVTVEKDETNPLTAKITGVDGSDNSSAVVTFTADGDPDADQTRPVVATLDVVCTKGEAVVAEITTDTPQDVP